METSHELLKIQSAMLEELVMGMGVEDYLGRLCLMIEGLVPGAFSSVMILDNSTRTLRVGAGPHMSKNLCGVLEGLVPGPTAASCGSAAFLGKAVLVEDTRTDPRWEDYKTVAEEFGIRSCWSIPIFRNKGQVAGTFAISSPTPMTPNEQHMRLLETASHLAGIAINRSEESELMLKLEAKIQQAQKLESLGLLASRIAHDLNNLLTSAVANIDIARTSLKVNSPVAEALNRVESAIDRMTDLSRQMLTYSGGRSLDLETVSLNDLVQGMADLLNASITKQARVQMNLPTDSPPYVSVDPTQIRQVIMNLIINASDAQGESGGIIGIRVGTIAFGSSDLLGVFPPESLQEGEYAVFEVSDTGDGMDDTTRNRMFDPFFTTKLNGHGLGLAATLGIVRSHDGAIRVDSEAGRGTVIQVLLPIATNQAQRVVALAQTIPKPHKNKSVLVVDDEGTIREVARLALEADGIQVTTAIDGADAVRKFNSQCDTIDAVLLDLTMPQMSGAEALIEIHKIKNVPVVLSSGHSQSFATDKLRGQKLAGYLQKPYRSRDLTLLFRKIFNELEENAQA